MYMRRSEPHVTWGCGGHIKYTKSLSRPTLGEGGSRTMDVGGDGEGSGERDFRREGEGY